MLHGRMMGMNVVSATMSTFSIQLERMTLTVAVIRKQNLKDSEDIGKEC